MIINSQQFEIAEKQVPEASYCFLTIKDLAEACTWGIQEAETLLVDIKKYVADEARQNYLRHVQQLVSVDHTLTRLIQRLADEGLAALEKIDEAHMRMRGIEPLADPAVAAAAAAAAV